MKMALNSEPIKKTSRCVEFHYNPEVTQLPIWVWPGFLQNGYISVGKPPGQLNEFPTHMINIYVV